jgi:hypothetical protein
VRKNSPAGGGKGQLETDFTIANDYDPDDDMPASADPITSTGIDIVGARIDGPVALAWAKTEFPLRAYKCAVKEKIVLDRSILRSLQLPGTQIKGLQGDGLTVEGDILLSEGFQAEGLVSLKESSIGGRLDCKGGQFINPGATALNLEDAKTGTVDLRDATAKGQVRLVNATVGGYLACDGGQFINPGATALNLEAAKTGTVLLRYGFRAEGRVWLVGVTIAGNLECDRSQFINPGATALELEYAKTGPVLLRDGFRAEGRVLLRDATVGGDLDCSNGHFINSNPGDWAINAEFANIQGSVLLVGGFEADGTVSFLEARIDREFLLRDTVWHENASLNLIAAKVKTLLNSANGWPNRDELLLHGLTFDELSADAQLSAQAQIDWINLQPSNPFRSQPYQQMGKVLRDMGLEEEATKMMIEKNWVSGQHAIAEDWANRHYVTLVFDLFWYIVFGPLIGYGYRPWYALIVSILFVGLGTFFFQFGYRHGIVTPTDRQAYVTDRAGTHLLFETYPHFHPFIYSLETFVPLVKLGIAQYWMILDSNRGARVGRKVNPWICRYLRLHILAGWILTTLWVGGVTGLIKG